MRGRLSCFALNQAHSLRVLLIRIRLAYRSQGESMAPRCDTLTTLSPLTNGFDDDISTRAIWNIAGHDKGGALEWKRSGRSWPFADTISPGSSSDPEVRSCKNLLQIWSSAARHLSPCFVLFFLREHPIALPSPLIQNHTYCSFFTECLLWLVEQN